MTTQVAECVDDPNDSCDPLMGGADCSGICLCVEVATAPSASYSSAPTIANVISDVELVPDMPDAQVEEAVLGSPNVTAAPTASTFATPSPQPIASPVEIQNATAFDNQNTTDFEIQNFDWQNSTDVPTASPIPPLFVYPPPDDTIPTPSPQPIAFPAEMVSGILNETAAPTGSTFATPSPQPVASPAVEIQNGTIQNGTAFDITQEEPQYIAPYDWVDITYDDFEGGWGSFEDNGLDALLYVTGSRYVYDGDSAAMIRDRHRYKAIASFSHKEEHDVSDFDKLRISFYFIFRDLESSEDFKVELRDNGVGEWVDIELFTYNKESTSGNVYYADSGKPVESGERLKNDVFYFVDIVVDITDTNPSTTQMRFKSSSSTDNDRVYIDNVKFQGHRAG